MTTTTDKPQHVKKVAVVDEISAKLTESEATVLTEYRGLTVAELAELRAALRPAGAEYKVYKNTLIRRAATQAGVEDIHEWLGGPVAIAFVTGDAASAAKAIRDFAKDAPALVVKGGLMAGRAMDASELRKLADLPPRDILLGTIAGAFQAPLVKAAGLFSAFTRNAAYAFSAYIDQRVAAGETVEAPAEEPSVETTNEPEATPEAESPETPEASEESDDASGTAATETDESTDSPE